MIPASRQRNYLQSGLYVIIVAILATILLERLLTYAEAAEKATMEATLSQLNRGLYARVAYFAMRGEYQDIAALQLQSPFVAADMRATNYLGEFVGVPAEAPGGNWLYDRVRHELVYIPNLNRHLVADPGDPFAGVLRFRMRMIPAAGHTYGGVALQPVTLFRWEPLP